MDLKRENFPGASDAGKGPVRRAKAQEGAVFFNILAESLTLAIVAYLFIHLAFTGTVL